MVPAETIIKVEDVHKNFTVGTQDVSVLKGVSFEINKGEFAIIIGPSGSGKSTLLHTILGLEPPTTGVVKILDTHIYLNTTEDQRSVFRKSHIGMVYQQPNWIKALSVLENVAFPLILLGVDQTESTKRAWKAVASMGMQSWLHYKPTELSGGQQQKIALARALVIDPEIIVADEPTGNLDFESGKNLMETLVSLNQQGRTILMVTHDLEYLKYCTKAVRILDGKISGVYQGEEVTNMLEAGNIVLKKAAASVPNHKGVKKVVKDTPEQEVAEEIITDSNIATVTSKVKASKVLSESLLKKEQRILVSSSTPTVEIANEKPAGLSSTVTSPATNDVYEIKKFLGL